MSIMAWTKGLWNTGIVADPRRIIWNISWGRYVFGCGKIKVRYFLGNKIGETSWTALARITEFCVIITIISRTFLGHRSIIYNITLKNKSYTNANSDERYFIFILYSRGRCRGWLRAIGFCGPVATGALASRDVKLSNSNVVPNSLDTDSQSMFASSCRRSETRKTPLMEGSIAMKPVARAE